MQLDATVAAYDPSNHNSCTYVYRVAGRSYANTDSCNYHGGGTVAIVYDRHDPSISIADDPTNELYSQLTVSLIAIVGFSLGITAGIRRLYRWFFSHEPLRFQPQ